MKIHKNINHFNNRRFVALFVLLVGTVFLGVSVHLVSAADGDKVTIVTSTNFRDYMSAYGNASIADGNNIITVTPQTTWQQGAVYFNERIDISQPFSVKLTVNIIEGTSADGMAFGFTESPVGTVGRNGPGFGIEGTQNSTVLTFDTYVNEIEPATPNASVRYTKGDSLTEGFFEEDGTSLGNRTPEWATSLTGVRSQFFSPFDLEMNYDPDTRIITYAFLDYELEAPIGDRGTEDGLAFVTTASTGGSSSGHRIEIQEIRATLLTPDPESITIGQDALTGDVLVTPLKAGGVKYPEGTLVSIDGIDGSFQVDADGTATIPKDQLAEYDASRPITIEETTKNPSNPTTEVVPGYRTSPPSEVDTTKNSDGTRTIIPLKEDGSRYPEHTVVDIPGIGEVTLNAEGEATIPVEDVPEFDETRSITLTEPGKDVSPNVEFVLPGSTTTAPDSPTATKDEDGTGVIHPTKPDGSSYPQGTIVEIVDLGEFLVNEDGNVTIPESQLPTYDTDTSIIIKEDGKEPSEGVPITIPGTTTIDPEATTVTKNPDGSATIVPTKPGGGTYPEGTIVDIPGIGEVILDENGAGTIFADDIPQYDTNAPATIKEEDKAASGEFTIPIEGYQTTSPDSIEVVKNPDGSGTVSVTKPDGSPYPVGTIVNIPNVGEINLDENGEGAIPASQMPTYDTTAPATVKEADKDASDSVSVLVPGSKTDAPGVVTVDKNPDGSGTVTVTKSGGGTYPAGTVVNLDGVGEVVLDENGNGTISADQMPTYDGNVNATVEEDGKEPSDSVSVPVEGSKTAAPTQILSEKNSDGTGTITPLKADGSPYAAGTIVTIDGIGTITLNENGEGTISANQMPEYDTLYSAVIEEAGKDGSDPSDVVLIGQITTPPLNMTVDKNPDGSITISPNKPDGSTYPESTVVTIPGIGDVILDENGQGIILANQAPLYDTDVTVTVTEPDKAGSEINVFIPGSKTSAPGPITTIQNPDGSVTIIVKKADGTNYSAGVSWVNLPEGATPPASGTVVYIPGIGYIALDENGEGVIPADLVPQYDTTFSNVTVIEDGRDPSDNTELFLAGSGIAPSAPNTGFGPLSSYSLAGLLVSIVGIVVGGAVVMRKKFKTN